MQKFLFLWLATLGLSAAAAEIKLDFNSFPIGQTPTNFTSALAGGGQPGDWKIISDVAPAAFAPLMPGVTTTTSEATRGVLAQLSQDPTDEHFPMLVYDGAVFKNFTITTQFKIVSGAAEQMAGIVFRYQNESNFYVARASALGHNLRFYKVVNGVRGNILGPDMAITTNVWHTLSVQCDGDQIYLYFDGALACPALEDTSFSTGKVGFWTKSDAVTYFSDTTIEYAPIVPAAQSLVNVTMQKYPRILGLRIYLPDAQGRMRVVASNQKAEIGMAGTDAEEKAYEQGTIFYGHGKGTVAITTSLNDRNGNPIAAVRVQLKSYALAETQDMVLDRVRIIINEMQKRVLSKEDLMQ
ncbi:MAG: family 16 glycoside hydrolase [Limisphaerales bacterium]